MFQRFIDKFLIVYLKWFSNERFPTRHLMNKPMSYSEFSKLFKWTYCYEPPYCDYLESYAMFDGLKIFTTHKETVSMIISKETILKYVCRIYELKGVCPFGWACRNFHISEARFTSPSEQRALKHLSSKSVRFFL